MRSFPSKLLSWIHPPTDSDVATLELPFEPVKCRTVSSLLCVVAGMAYALPARVSRFVSPYCYSANENSNLLVGSPLRNISLKCVFFSPIYVIIPTTAAKYLHTKWRSSLQGKVDAHLCLGKLQSRDRISLSTHLEKLNSTQKLEFLHPRTTLPLQ